MKTPEQMAGEYAHANTSYGHSYSIAREAFLAGYQAAKDEDNAKMQELEANWKFCCEDKARLLNELAVAERAKEQFADGDKVMNSSNNSNGWISVKERLPEDHQYVLGVVFGDIEIGYINRLTTDPNEFSWEAGDNWIDKGHSALTHWMPLPEAPKEEG